MSAPTKTRKRALTPEQKTFLKKYLKYEPATDRGQKHQDLVRDAKTKLDLILNDKNLPDKTRRNLLKRFQAVLKATENREENGVQKTYKDNLPKLEELIEELEDAKRRADGRKDRTEELLKEASTLLTNYLKSTSADPKRGLELSAAFKAAQKERSEGKYLEAFLALKQLIRDIRDAEQNPGPKDDRVLSKKQQKEKELKDKLAFDKAELETALSVVGELLSKDVLEIMEEHQGAVGDEAKAFKDLRFVDDLIAITDKAKRTDTIKEVAAAVAAARDRKDRMAVALAKMPKDAPDEVKQAQLRVWRLQTTMTDHIPDAFLLEHDLEERVDTLEYVEQHGMESKEAIKRLIGDPLEDDEDKQKERKAFLDAIGHGSLKPAELTEFYFDVGVRAMTPEQAKAVAKANEAVLARAHMIRDQGGTVQDVEKAIAHIPEEFWPPSLVKELQAWRKVEREMAEIRVSEMFAKPGKVTGWDVLSSVTGVSNFLGDLASLGGNIGAMTLDSYNLANGLTGDDKEALPTEVKAGQAILEGLKDLTKPNTPFAKAIETGDWTALTPDDVAALAGRMSQLVSRFKLLGDSAGTWATVIAPAFGAVGSGIDLVVTFRQFIKIAEERDIAVDELRNFEMEYWSGNQTDEALLGALKNEFHSKQQQLTKKGVETTGKALGHTGDLMNLGGVTAPVGATFKVVGKSIEVGNKIHFSRIDWSHANKAMDLLNEAQAGNPIARTQIFKDCHLYAKMYICVLAREKNPIAHEFIVNRGLTEGDLSKSQALMILSQKLMKKAEQKDDRKNTELGEALSTDLLGEATTKIAKAVGRSVKAKFEELGDKIRASKTTAYNAVPLGQPELKVENWTAAKATAVANGLYDESTGITKALEELKPLLSYADGFASKKLKSEPADMKKRILAAEASLEKLEQTILAYTPITGKGDDHPEMLDYLADLRTAALTKRNQLHQALFDLDICTKPDQWTPPAPDVDTVADWEANWNDLVENCGVSEDDGGVGKALKRVFKTHKERAATGLSAAEQRKLNLRYRDELRELAVAMDNARKLAAEIPPAQSFLDTCLSGIISESQDVNENLAKTPWAGNPVAAMDESVFTPEKCTEAFTKAVEEGYVRSIDAKLSKAIKEALKIKALLDDDKVKDEKIATARMALCECLGKVAKAAHKALAANPDTHPEMAAYLQFLKDHAQQTAAEQRNAIRAVKFDAGEVKLTAASWTKCYFAAVKAGAVPDIPAGGELQKRLGNLESAIKVFLPLYDKPSKKTQLACQVVVLAVAKLDVAITRTNNLPGFDHPTLRKYLQDLAKLAKETDPDMQKVKKVKEGDFDNPDFKPGRFEWSHSGWEKVRDHARECGILPEKKRTGIAAALKTAKKSFDAWQKEGSESKKAKLVDQADADLLALDTVVKKLLSSCKNATMKTYLDAFLLDIQGRRNNFKV